MSDDLKCPHPDCDDQVLLDWHLAYAMSTDDVHGDDAEPFLELVPPDSHAMTWSIGCAAGHVLLIPGLVGCGCESDCKHDPDDYDQSEDARMFRQHDYTRLRTVLNALAGTGGTNG